MLLGIVLHAALSFTSIPWVVQDSQQSESYHVLFACVHGFRMPLFFMLSGFFTAMLWRKRGLESLVKHRFQRIFLATRHRLPDDCSGDVGGQHLSLVAHPLTDQRTRSSWRQLFPATRIGPH